MAPARTQCAGCHEHDRRIAELEDEVAQLRQQLRHGDREHNRQAHPFRLGQGTTHPK